MSEPRDIIGIVKELLVMDATTFRPSTSSPLERQEHWHFFEQKLQHHFADIAQALLIAVEALEESAKRCRKGCKGHDVQSGEPLCAGCPTVEALSRIRSLPSA